MVEIGSTIGNYQVLQKIGEGAMGAVYLAAHPTIGKRVALKVIHSQLSSDEEVVARFFNEARAVTLIGHPNIVDVQDFGQTPSGESFIVMELLEGVGLGDLLRRDGPLPIDRAVKIAAGLSDGLRAAHVAGIVHRDLKPDNIFLISRGGDPDFVKILDFGLAKLSGPGAVVHKTRTGAVLGTAHYMAPEAAEDARKVDHRVDIYALGCILFQMVTGRVPFPGEGYGEVLVRHIREPPPLPTRLRGDVPQWLEKVILHALAKKQDFRFASMDDFGRALRDPVAWERAFDDRDVSDTWQTAVPVALTTPSLSSGLVRSAQIAADAPTVSVPAPAPLVETSFHAKPTALVSSLPTDVAAEETRGSRAQFSSGAAIGGALAVLGIAAAIVYRLVFMHIAVSIVTEPAGAEILVDNAAVGISPGQVKLPRRHRTMSLVLRKPGFASERREIDALHDVALDVRLTAVPAPVVAPPVAVSVAATAAVTPVTAHETHVHREVSKKRDKSATAGYKRDGVLLAPSF